MEDSGPDSPRHAHVKLRTLKALPPLHQRAAALHAATTSLPTLTAGDGIESRVSLSLTAGVATSPSPGPSQPARVVGGWDAESPVRGSPLSSKHGAWEETVDSDMKRLKDLQTKMARIIEEALVRRRHNEQWDMHVCLQHVQKMFMYM